MADKKISELTALTSASLADGDQFHIRDISEALAADQNKSIDFSEIKTNLLPRVVTYTPTMVGLGTVTNVQFRYVERNGLLTLWGQYQTGSPSAVEVQIGLPSGHTVHSTYSAITNNGFLQRNNLSTARYQLLITGGDAFINVGRLDSGTGSYVPMIGTGGMGTSEIQSFACSVFVDIA